MGVLSDVKVLDLTRLLPGPYCTLLMADYGAEVIKIEEPGKGDYIRWRTPAIESIGARHLTVNRNKKSVELNLKTAEGQQIFKQLAAEADVIIESFRPGVMQRLGLSYEDIVQVNERIVYCSLTGYGQTGPYQHLPGHDINYIGYSGILGLIGEKDGKPIVPGVQIADIGGGSLMALAGICMALFHRDRTGKGQYIDVSMMDGAITWLYAAMSDYFASDTTPKRGTTRLDGQFAFYNVYETRDGKYITVGASELKFWKKMCELIGKEEWIPLHEGPTTVQEQLKQDLAKLFKTHDQQYWVDLLAREDTCVGPVHDIDEMFNDPHITAREMFTEMHHPIAGMIKQIGFPIKFSETPGEIYTHAPILGEHTTEILTNLGYSTEDMKHFRTAGVIGQTPVTEHAEP